LGKSPARRAAVRGDAFSACASKPLSVNSLALSQNARLGTALLAICAHQPDAMVEKSKQDEEAHSAPFI
jgi:hypothetical protein